MTVSVPFSYLTRAQLRPKFEPRTCSIRSIRDAAKQKVFVAPFEFARSIDRTQFEQLIEGVRLWPNEGVYHKLSRTRFCRNSGAEIAIPANFVLSSLWDDAWSLASKRIPSPKASPRKTTYVLHNRGEKGSGVPEYFLVHEEGINKNSLVAQDTRLMRNALEQLKPDSRSIGVRVATYFQFGEQAGAIVAHVNPDAKAKDFLQQNDVIFAGLISGTTTDITTTADLVAVVKNLPTDSTTIRLAVERGSETDVFDVPLTKLLRNNEATSSKLKTCVLDVYPDKNGDAIGVLPASILRQITNNEFEAVVSQIDDHNPMGAFHTFRLQALCEVEDTHVAFPVKLFGTTHWDAVKTSLDISVSSSSPGGYDGTEIMATNYRVREGHVELAAAFMGQPPGNVSIAKRIAGFTFVNGPIIVASTPNKGAAIAPALILAPPQSFPGNTAANNDSIDTNPFQAALISFGNGFTYEFGDEILCFLKGYDGGFSATLASPDYRECRENTRRSIEAHDANHSWASLIGALLGYITTPLATLFLISKHRQEKLPFTEIFKLHFKGEMIEGGVVAFGQLLTHGEISVIFFAMVISAAAGVIRGVIMASIYQWKRDISFRVLFIALGISVIVTIIYFFVLAGQANAGGGNALREAFKDAVSQTAKRADEAAKLAKQTDADRLAKAEADRLAEANRLAKVETDKVAKQAEADRLLKQQKATKLAEKAKADAARAQQSATLKKQRDQIKRDAAMAKLKKLPAANDNVAGGAKSSFGAIEVPKKALAGNPTGKVKADAGAAVRKAEINADTAKAINDKVQNHKFFRKRKAESNIQQEKRVAEQKKLEEAAHLAKKRQFQQVPQKKRSALKKKLRDEKSRSKKEGLKKISNPRNATTKDQGHILARHGTGSKYPKKDKFSENWSNERIFHNVSEIATDPKSIHIRNNQDTLTAIGIRDGEIIGVNYSRQPADKNNLVEKLINIDTAYPIKHLKGLDDLIDEGAISYFN